MTRLVLCLGLCLCTAQARAEEAGRASGRRPSGFIELSLGGTGEILASERVLPRAAGMRGGPGLLLGLGVRDIGWFQAGGRVWLNHFATGMSAGAILGEVGAALSRGPWRFTFRLGAGYGWLSDINLEKLDLGRYSDGSFVLSVGPHASYEVARAFSVGLGLRGFWAGITRPALGPCDEAHGCNGVFYPDEEATGRMLLMFGEFTATYAFP